MHSPPLAQHIETELTYDCVQINTMCYRFHNYDSFISVFCVFFWGIQSPIVVNCTGMNKMYIFFQKKINCSIFIQCFLFLPAEQSRIRVGRYLSDILQLTTYIMKNHHIIINQLSQRNKENNPYSKYIINYAKTINLQAFLKLYFPYTKRVHL